MAPPLIAELFVKLHSLNVAYPLNIAPPNSATFPLNKLLEMFK